MSPPEALPVQESATPAAPLPPARNKRLLLVGGLGAAAVIGIGVFLAWPSDFPLALGELPSDTQLLQSEDRMAERAARFHLVRSDLPEEASWALFAREGCNGEDLFETLMIPGDKRTRDEKWLKRQSELLACGRTIAEELGSNPRRHFVRFNARSDRRDVLLYGMAGKRLKEVKQFGSPPKEPVGFESALCLKDGSSCDGPTWAKVPGRNAWVVGRESDLSAFGNDFSAAGKNRFDEMDSIKKLMSSLSGHRVLTTTIEFGRFNDLLPESGDRGATNEFEKALRDARSWGCSYAEEGGFTRSTCRFRFANAGDARAAASAMDKYLREARRHARERERDYSGRSTDSEDKDVRAYLKLYAAYEKALVRVSARTLEEPRVEASDERLELVLAPRTDSDDVDAWKAFAAANAERARRVAAVLRNVADGVKPSSSLLKELDSGAHNLFDWSPPPPPPPAAPSVAEPVPVPSAPPPVAQPPAAVVPAAANAPAEAPRPVAAPQDTEPVKPSFPCEKATTPTEHAICDTPALARLDNQLARLYSAKRAANPDVKRSQLEFLGHLRRCNGVFACIETLQKERVAELEALP